MEQFAATKNETRKHILLVGTFLNKCIIDLLIRASEHDKSKLNDNEAPYFDKYTSELSKHEYNSKEYKHCLLKLQPALKEHYAKNDHHPEYFKNGINDMSLIQIIEMLADWKASCSRLANGNILTSIESNQKRFGYSDDIKRLLINTVKYLDW